MSFHSAHRALVASFFVAATACSAPGSMQIPATSSAAPVPAIVHRSVVGDYTFTTYTIPTANSYPNRIISGPGGALWFTEEGYAASKIGELTVGGAFSEYPVTAGSEPSHLAWAYGNVWFSCANADSVGYVTPTGQATYYSTQSSTRGIAEGAGSGRVWFTEFESGNVSVVDSTTGVITEYHVPTQSSEPYDVAFGPGKSVLWFTEYGAKKIGSVSGNGTFIEYPVPSYPKGLAYGPDGALWFTLPKVNKIGQMTTSGSVTTYAIPTAMSNPGVITKGPDGALWFTEFNASKIGRITTSGTITETATPDANAQPTGITTGPNKHIWFVEHAANKIVQLTR